MLYYKYNMEQVIQLIEKKKSRIFKLHFWTHEGGMGKFLSSTDFFYRQCKKCLKKIAIVDLQFLKINWQTGMLIIEPIL